MNRAVFVLTLMGWLLVPCAASAQTVPSLADLQVAVESGQKISVEGADGKAIVGKLTAISSNELQLETGGLFSQKKEAFTVGSIHRVKVIDPLGNGILAGLGGGIALAAIGAATAGIGNPDVTGAMLFAQACLLTVPIGIGIGALVDRHINRTVFERARGTTLTMTPLLGSRRGVQVSLQF